MRQGSPVVALARHAETRPGELGLAFLPRRGPAVELTWGALHARVRALGAHLAGAGVSPGEVLFVLSAAPHEQALGFLGALAAGALPAILSFPSVKQSRERFHETLRPIARGAGARWILSSRELARAASFAGAEHATLEIPPAEALDRAGDTEQLPPPAPAFLQFSSGTTGLRKCVRITSEMLVAQADAYAQAIDLGAGDRIASWLPLYHDMGLVAALLVPLVRGNLSVHLSPFDWLEDPALLFRAVTAHRATLAWLPNFAYRLMADQIQAEDLAGVDLGSLRALVNCSEPVQHSAHEAFLARFAGAGVRPEHLQACYAMAECTFAVTQTTPGRAAVVDRVRADAFATSGRAEPVTAGEGPVREAVFVSSGRLLAGTEVRVDGAAAERRVGEILIRSPSLVPGYGVDGGERGGAFTDDGWYRTGDLGYLAGGELFVTGRAKDLIIHRGSNVYPHDVEEILRAVPGIRPGRAVVFGVFDESEGTERVVAMAEIEEGGEPLPIQRLARERVWAEMGIALADVRLCAAGALQKSTSGKLSRAANRERYLADAPARRAGQRPALPDEAVAPRDRWERQLAWIWEDMLGVRPIGVKDNLFLDLAADSIAATRAAGEIQRRFQRDLPPGALLGAETVERQAALLRSGEGSPGPLVTLERRGAAPPLFLAHAAGGWAFPYVSLARRLGAERPVHAFEAPALSGGGVASLTVEGLAETYLAALRRTQASGPYHLAGWSFGGYLAFEVARRLAAAGERVASLVLFDTAPPPGLRRRLEMRALAAAAGIAFRASLGSPRLQARIPGLRDLGAMTPLWRFFAGYHLGGDATPVAVLIAFAFPDRSDPAALGRMSEGELWDHLVSLANERPTQVDQLLLIPGLDGAAARRALAVSRKLEQLNARYAPRAVYPGTIDVFGVRGNEGLRAWQAHTEAPLRIHWFDVKRRLVNPHCDMMEDENVKLFAPALRDSLRAADAALPRRSR